jgi:peptide/nickel transport system permease protein
MLQYILRRLLLMIPVALIVSFITFMLIHLIPGDPARVLLGEEATPQALAALHKQLGLDDPIIVQYIRWLGNLLHGDMGQSIQQNEAVSTSIIQRLPVTIELGIAALVYSIVLAIPLGILAAAQKNTIIDWIIGLVTLIGTSIPGFVLGLLLIFFFAVFLRIAPPGGYISLGEDPVQNLQDLILPMITLGTGAVTINLRQVRAIMLEVLEQDYIRTARAKGLSNTRVLYIHALRNALLPVLTIVGLQAGAILGGAFIVEQIFLWPGIGSLALNSILSKDYLVVQGVVLLSALSYMAVNLAVDLSYSLLDPRISYHDRRA